MNCTAERGIEPSVSGDNGLDEQQLKRDELAYDE